jgi:carbon-monoxide dehydrogenase medium subunit
MYPRAFEYFVPRSVREVTELLVRRGEEAKILAGGQSLIPLMKLRLASPGTVIDIGQLPDLRCIREVNGSLAIGALTSHASVLESALVRQGWPLITDAVGVIGDSQVRNWGTAGGALAEADPAGDWGPIALALKARIRCTGNDGERTLDAESFFVDAYTTELKPDELITEIIFPAPAQGTAAAYLKLERRAGDFAVASVAVQLTLDEKGTCQTATLALGAAGLTPIQAYDAATFLHGKELRSDVIHEAARKVAREAQPLADIRGSEDYKRAAVGALFKDAVDVALRRFRGETVEVGHVH